jgi:hypothetical protein
MEWCLVKHKENFTFTIANFRLDRQRRALNRLPPPPAPSHVYRSLGSELYRVKHCRYTHLFSALQLDRLLSIAFISQYIISLASDLSLHDTVTDVVHLHNLNKSVIV